MTPGTARHVGAAAAAPSPLPLSLLCFLHESLLQAASPTAHAFLIVVACPFPCCPADFGVSLDLGQVRWPACSLQRLWPLRYALLCSAGSCCINLLPCLRLASLPSSCPPLTASCLQYERFRRILYTVSRTEMAALSCWLLLHSSDGQRGCLPPEPYPHTAFPCPAALLLHAAQLLQLGLHFHAGGVGVGVGGARPRGEQLPQGGEPLRHATACLLLS